MQHLDVSHWYQIRLGSMPKLQSLRLRDNLFRMVPLGELPPLKMLALAGLKCTSVLRHSHSLTKLMLDNISLVDAISGPATFPSLTYLSLRGVTGLKPHINAPRLVTYHEDGSVAHESFPISLPSLVEYGVYHALVEYGVYHPPTASLDPATWHLSFPNIQRLALRVDERDLLSFFPSFANQTHLLPALQTISVGGRRSHEITEGVMEKIKSLVLVRHEDCNGNIVVCFETVTPFQIPIFFGAVSKLSIRWPFVLLMHILDTRSC